MALSSKRIGIDILRKARGKFSERMDSSYILRFFLINTENLTLMALAACQMCRGSHPARAY
jgi:hypothetical protein